MRNERVAIIGAGMGGLAAAAILAARGAEVAVFESAASPGGKMREVEVNGTRIDAGPTVFTMRWVFEGVFDAAGATLRDRVKLNPLPLLARHAWSEQERLDLFADIAQSADAIGTFAGAAEARGYRKFAQRARRVYELLEQTFICQPAPRMENLVLGAGLRIGSFLDIAPFSAMWGALGKYFRDPRLRQLFGRYATYCGSSPFAAPATLMLVAHVEQAGVWEVEGGMYRLADALAALAREHGAEVRCCARVTEILFAGGRAAGVGLASGERFEADAVIANVDVAAIAAGLLGDGASHAVPKLPVTERSLSAVTWAMVAEARGFPLARHNVFFARDYKAEFDDILRLSRTPTEPTVYVCAQDRAAAGANAGPERLLCLVNAPARADVKPMESAEIVLCEERAWRQLERCGLSLRKVAPAVMTTPSEFHSLFPGTGGALYGRASHGWRASFQRPGCRTKIPGLYLAGGSTHPGPGIPMAALSGRMAAESLLSDLASTSRSRGAATRGGTWTR